MTTTPHGQVPEALIDLIDAYAETRHRYGGIYNARTEAARKAVIEALSGVQALSAAQAGWKTVPVNPTPEMWKAAKTVPDPNPPYPPHYGLAWDAMLAASPTPPAEQPATKETSGGFHVWRDISTAPKDGSRFVATGYNYGLCSEVRHTCVAQWLRGCWMEASDWNETSELKYLTHWMPLPPLPGNAAPKAAPGEPFQHRVQPWLLQCFGAEIAADTVERNHRFLEEALELVQSTGCTQSEAHQLVDYVFGRPVGEPAQEVGGVMVTLAALCLAGGLDMRNAGEIELARIWTKVEAIRAKQAAKPKHSPLPQAAPQQEAQEPALFVSPKQLAALADPDDPEGEHGRYLPARKTSKGLFTQPLYSAPQPAPAPLSEMPYEKRKAIQEGEQIGASDAWFKARHEMLDTVDRRNVFRAGFDRGWNAALAAQGGKA